jgi:serine/threonine protein kinase
LQKPYGKEVDLWSLGVISYLLLSRVLPFDDEDDREIARQTIYEPPDFSFHPWEKVSEAGKDICKSKFFHSFVNKFKSSSFPLFNLIYNSPNK